MKNQKILTKKILTKNIPMINKSWSWFTVWNISLLHPNNKTADAILSEANISFKQAYIWITVTSIIFQLFYSIILWIKYPSPIDVTYVFTLVKDCFIAGLLSPISFVALTGLIHLLALIFRTKGTFQNFFIIYVAFSSPILLLSIIIAFIWQISRIETILFLGVLLSFYLIFVVSTKAIMANYRFHWLGALLIGFLVQIIYFISFLSLFLALNPSIITR